MTSDIQIRRVESSADFDTFYKFPWAHYQDQPYWIPSLPSLRRDTLNKAKHAAWEYMDGEYFIAWRGAEALGTIAAFVNHRHNEIHHENIGFFGFFDCINDQAAADSLFKTAEDYLRGQGVTDIRGPANFSSNEEYGLLIDCFDQYPMVLMPYNPPYYVNLIENYGFQKVMDLYAWRMDKSVIKPILYEDDGTPKRALRAVRRSMERHQITIRPINMRDKKKEFLRLRDLYNDAWEQNWGFIPMTDRELDNLVADLGMLLAPRYTIFADVKGEAAGFFLLVPNFNEVMQYVRPHPGLPEPWWLAKTVWHWKLRPKVTSLRAILLGVKPQFRGMGVDAAMYLAIGDTLLKDPHIQWVEAGWTLENNDPVNQSLEHFSRLHRKHRIYQKAL